MQTDRRLFSRNPAFGLRDAVDDQFDLGVGHGDRTEQVRQDRQYPLPQTIKGIRFRCQPRPIPRDGVPNGCFTIPSDIDRQLHKMYSTLSYISGIWRESKDVDLRSRSNLTPLRRRIAAFLPRRSIRERESWPERFREKAHRDRATLWHRPPVGYAQAGSWRC